MSEWNISPMLGSRVRASFFALVFVYVRFVIECIQVWARNLYAWISKSPGKKEDNA